MSVRYTHTRLRIPDEDAPVPPDLHDRMVDAAAAGARFAKTHFAFRAYAELDPEIARESLQPWIAASRQSQAARKALFAAFFLGATEHLVSLPAGSRQLASNVLQCRRRAEQEMIRALLWLPKDDRARLLGRSPLSRGGFWRFRMPEVVTTADVASQLLSMEIPTFFPHQDLFHTDLVVSLRDDARSGLCVMTVRSRNPFGQGSRATLLDGDIRRRRGMPSLGKDMTGFLSETRGFRRNARETWEPVVIEAAYQSTSRLTEEPIRLREAAARAVREFHPASAT